jgi:hypothetical protein
LIAVKKLVAAVVLAVSAVVSVSVAQVAPGSDLLAGPDDHWCC